MFLKTLTLALGVITAASTASANCRITLNDGSVDELSDSITA